MAERKDRERLGSKEGNGNDGQARLMWFSFSRIRWIRPSN